MFLTPVAPADRPRSLPSNQAPRQWASDPRQWARRQAQGATIIIVISDEPTNTIKKIDCRFYNSSAGYKHNNYKNWTAAADTETGYLLYGLDLEEQQYVFDELSSVPGINCL